MHIDVRKRRISATGPSDKTAVFGVLERSKGDGGHSKVKTKVITDRKKKTLQAEVKASVQAGAALYSDALLSYDGLESEYAHQVVDHAVKYVRGRIYTNGLEDFWSLFKRGINGTHVSVEPFRLFRYLDEQEFRFNNRGTRKNPISDGDRFDIAVRQIIWKAPHVCPSLTGNVGEAAFWWKASESWQTKSAKRIALNCPIASLPRWMSLVLSDLRRQLAHITTRTAGMQFCYRRDPRTQPTSMPMSIGDQTVMIPQKPKSRWIITCGHQRSRQREDIR